MIWATKKRFKKWYEQLGNDIRKDLGNWNWKGYEQKWEITWETEKCMSNWDEIWATENDMSNWEMRYSEIMWAIEKSYNEQLRHDMSNWENDMDN